MRTIPTDLSQAFFNRYKKFKSEKISNKDWEEQFLNERVYMELIHSIKNDCANSIKFFPMADLTKQYEDQKIPIQQG
jgi:hypothetical protein